MLGGKITAKLKELSNDRKRLQREKSKEVKITSEKNEKIRKGPIGVHKLPVLFQYISHVASELKV